MPSWPSSLPTKVIAGSHHFQAKPNVVSFEPDVGEPIRRRRYTGKSAVESFELVLTSAQKDRLHEFWSDDCAQGTLSFYATLIDGIARKWWFSPDTPPDYSNVRGGTAYRVTLNMGCRR